MRSVFLTAVFFLVVGWLAIGPLEGTHDGVAFANDDGSDQVIRIGFDQRIFGDIDKKDAEAVINLYIKEWGKQMNYQTEALLYADIHAIISDLQAQNLDMVSINLPEYAILSKKVATDLAYTNTNKGRKTKKWMLLVNRKSGAKSLEDLRGKRLVLSSGNTVGNIFIDTIILRHNHTPADRFFNEIITSVKPSKMILDLFFNRIDACLVDDWTLDAMVELNPQIRENYHVLAESSPMVTSVTFFRKEIGARMKKYIKERSSLADTSIYGEQLLLLFKSDGIEDLKKSDLNTFYQLADEYERRMAQWKVQ